MGMKKKIVTKKNWYEQKFRYEKNGYEKNWARKKRGTKKIGYVKFGYEKHLGTTKMITKIEKLGYEKSNLNCLARELSPGGELSWGCY